MSDSDKLNKFFIAAEEAGVLVAVYASASVFSSKYKGKEPMIGEWDQEIRDKIFEMEKWSLAFSYSLSRARNGINSAECADGE